MQTAPTPVKLEPKEPKESKPAGCSGQAKSSAPKDDEKPMGHCPIVNSDHQSKHHQSCLNEARLEEEKLFFQDDFTSESGKMTTNLIEALDFYNGFLDEVLVSPSERHGGFRGDPSTATIDELAAWVQSATHSSAFSGVASPETALLGLHKAIQRRLPDRQEGFQSSLRHV